MKRNKDLKKNRVDFVKLAFNNKKEGAKKLRGYARGLENCKNNSDTVFALSQIFGVTEKTIMRDLISD